MIEQIQTLSDKTKFEEIFNRFFINSDLLLKLKNRDVKTKFLGYAGDQVGFRIPDLKNVPDDCIVEFKNEVYTIYLNLKFIEKQETDVFIFKPVKFQFISQNRTEERISLDNGSGKKLVFITNVISDFIIYNILSQRLKIIDKIKDSILSDMEKAFESIKIFFINEGVSDSRMKFFIKEKVPLYIYDVNIPEKNKNKKIFQEYMKNIYATDISIKHKNFISEISVPFLYRAKMPYGYIQINSTSPIPEITYNTIKKFSVQVDEMFKKDKIFSGVNENFIVNNISKQGFGIVFNEKKYIRYFKENSTIYVDINFPGQKKLLFLQQ